MVPDGRFVSKQICILVPSNIFSSGSPRRICMNTGLLLGVGVGDGDGLGEGLGEGLGVGVLVLDGVGVGLGVGLGGGTNIFVVVISLLLSVITVPVKVPSTKSLLAILIFVDNKSWYVTTLEFATITPSFLISRTINFFAMFHNSENLIQLNKLRSR